MVKRVISIQQVLESVEDFENTEVEKAWLDEAEKRWLDIEQGSVQCISA